MGAADDAELISGPTAALGKEWSVAVPPGGPARLATYFQLLLRWSRHINLTGARSLDELATEHLPDSFAVASRLGAGALLVDIGSGGGLPAIPLALLRPDLRMTCVEPIHKKVAFLRTAVRELGLGQAVTVLAGRSDDVPSGTFDVAMSRATFAPADWLEIGQRLIRPGGSVISLSSERLSTPPGWTEVSQTSYARARRWLAELRPPTPA